VKYVGGSTQNHFQKTPEGHRTGAFRFPERGTLSPEQGFPVPDKGWAGGHRGIPDRAILLIARVEFSGAEITQGFRHV
jgi:hypothetical protein